MKRAKASDLLYLSKLDKKTIDSLFAGVSLESRTGYPLATLSRKVVEDRLALAKKLLRSAQDEMTRAKPCHRTAVSRSYYSMYHAFRAVVFAIHGGDDHQEHAKLPSAIPQDFPSRSHWENDLKTARLDRNRADYDPYPRGHRAFQATATNTLARATALLPVVRDYLRKKGKLP